jgi:hypothetical protein
MFLRFLQDAFFKSEEEIAKISLEEIKELDQCMRAHDLPRRGQGYGRVNGESLDSDPRLSLDTWIRSNPLQPGDQQARSRGEGRKGRR